MVTGFGLLHQRVSLTHALIAVLVASELFVAVRRVGLDFHRSEESQRATITLSRLDTAETHATSDCFSAVDLVAIDGAVPLTFRVRPGERLLLTGPSGVGKTSTLLALLGWHAPVSGTVAAPTGPFAYVAPTSPLLAGTIRENLLLANNDRDVEAETLLTCLGLSARLCNLDTSIGSDASLLSSGERVRLVLARALLNGAQFLLLDDIAGVLDETSRDAVRQLLSSATQLGIIEATVATPLLRDAIEMKCAREY
jgi:ABC-type transport system involved in cytochrome bd biosynthesis fused ATPase/permease subunit